MNIYNKSKTTLNTKSLLFFLGFFKRCSIKDHYIRNQPNEKSVRQWSGRLGFNPRSSHTKDLKNGT